VPAAAVCPTDDPKILGALGLGAAPKGVPGGDNDPAAAKPVVVLGCDPKGVALDAGAPVRTRRERG
jgi:hypothetical protein